MSLVTNPASTVGAEPKFVAGQDAPDFDPGFVRRPRLTERLLRSSPARLVLLTAPAGYSKTTCLAEWAAVDDRPFAWLAASDRHDDPALLVSSIVDALDQIEPVDPGVVASLASPRPNISDVVLPRLSESLRSRTKPLVFVVDDVHELSTDESFEILDAVVEYLPVGSQVAIASRTEPPLPLGRMRAHRHLVEIDQHDLAMTAAESGELLANLGIGLNSRQLDVIYERTEGWPAALYLAGLALINQPDLAAAVSNFAGDDRIVVDYLRDEFLSSIGSAGLSFLTRSSVLDELSAPLCDAVLERSGSGRLLKQMARSNFLIVPLDRSDHRYRYHPLFAEMLRAELERRDPASVPELHARASRWYADHSDLDRAIDHAIEAGDTEWVGELTWLAFPEVSGRGRIASLERWLNRLGEDRVASSSRLALVSAHCYLALGEGDRAEHWARVAAGVAAGSPGGVDEILGELCLLSATSAPNGVVQMGKDAARAAELHPAESPWQTPAYLYRGVSSHLTGHPERAVPLLQESARRGAIDSSIIQTLALSQLALIAIDAHDMDSASRLTAQARDQVRRCGLSDYPVVVGIFAVSALVHANDGQIELAEKDIHTAKRLLALLNDFPPWYETQVRIVLAQACIRLDDPANAREMLDEGSLFMEGASDASILSGWLARARTALESSTVERMNREWALTTAELRTLQYMPSHLSFREIGERIHVSPNTVKTQAQAVYRKLSASSRTEAVEMARDAGLLGEDPPTPR